MTGLEVAIVVLGLVLLVLGIYMLARPEPSVARLVETGAFTDDRARRMIRRRAWGGVVMGVIALLVIAASRLFGT